jgi:flagellar M-ring protein FliF
VDFAQVEATSETFAPNQSPDKAAIRSQTTAEASQPGPATPQGVPGALSNQPPVPATAPIAGGAAPLNPAQGAAGNSTRRDATTNFEVDRNVRHTRQGAGQIRRLTAAVVVNFKGSGAQAAALSDKELANVNALVREAMGFTQQRGDSVNVVNAQFNQPEFAPAEPLPAWQQPEMVALAREAGKAMLFLLLTLLVVFGVLRPALRAMAPKAPPPAPEEAEAAPVAALPAPSAEEAVPPIELSPLDRLRELAKNDPGTVANVVKTWVSAEAKA